MITTEDLDQSLHWIAAYKNPFFHWSGYTPLKLVSGKDPRLPHELPSDEDPRLQDAISREQSQRDEVRMRAWKLASETDARARVQAAQRNRTHQDQVFFPCQRVSVWRRQVVTSSTDALRVRMDRWVGPGTMVFYRGTTVCVSMRAPLWNTVRL